jgi:futalosine hydrolase
VRVVEDSFIDLGAETPEGFLDLWSLGIPEPGSERRYSASDFPPVAHLPAARGGTCSTCTGTISTQLLREAMGVQVESMEGAAWALVADRCSIFFHQVRAISNLSGPRDRSSWMLREALDALSSTLESLSR